MRSNDKGWTLDRILCTFALTLTIGAGWFYLCSHPRIKHQYATPVTLTQIKDDYLSYNSMWFDGKLPKDVTISRIYGNSFQAYTTKENGHFVIRFNPKFNIAKSQADMNILHEQCHLKTWVEFSEHGPMWVGCMRDLAARGAFDSLW
jgi:hypothetical protein